MRTPLTFLLLFAGSFSFFSRAGTPYAPAPATASAPNAATPAPSPAKPTAAKPAKPTIAPTPTTPPAPPLKPTATPAPSAANPPPANSPGPQDSGNALEAKDYLEFLEVDPPPPGILIWGKEDRRQLFTTDGQHLFFYLIGRVTYGYSVTQGDRPLPLGANNSFKLKVEVPLEPATIAWKIKGPEGAVFAYRLTTVWKKLPPGMRVNILDEGKISRLSTGFTGTIKEIGYSQLFTSQGPTRFLSQPQLDDDGLSFRIFPPPIAAHPNGWRLLIRSEGHEPVRKLIGGAGEPPASVEWSKIAGNLETPGIYSYRLFLLYDGKIYAGMPNKFAILGRKPRNLSTSLGLSSISYSETGVPDYSAMVLTLKAAYDVQLVPSAHLDLGVNAFVTLFTLSNNQPGTDVRFLGANLRLGYTLPFIHSPWSVRLSFGGYYETSFVTADAFGFKDLFMMQFTPSVRFAINHTNAVGLYLKAAPVGAGFFTFDFSQREFAAGVYYEHWLPNEHPFFVGVDYSNLQMVLTPSVVDLTTISFSAGYRF